MKKLNYLFASVAVFVLPLLASAQGPTDDSPFDPDGGALGDFLQDILIFINNILIPFIIGIGFLIFVWGMFQYFIAGGANEEAKEKGKSMMIWATLGFVIIIVFWGIINVIAGSTGLNQNLDTGLIPNAPELPTDGASQGGNNNPNN